MATSTKPGKSGDAPVKTASRPAAAKTVKKAATAKAPAVRKPAAKKPAAEKAAKPVAAKQVAAPELAPEKRRYYVEVSAYYLAERRGFHGGSQLEDWVRAEAEIDRLLQEGILKP